MSAARKGCSGQGVKKERERRKTEREPTGRWAAGRKRETEIEKEDDAPSTAQLEVENFLIENYESYLLCRGFGRRVALVGEWRRAAERKGDAGEREKEKERACEEKRTRIKEEG